MVQVSRAWLHLLSSPPLCRAAVRETLGKDPWTPTPPSAQTMTLSTRLPDSCPESLETADSTVASNKSSNTLTLANTPSSAPSSNSYSSTSFMKWAKRRYRLEEGIPYKVNQTLSPLADEGQNRGIDARAVVTYSDGYCAWVDPRDDRKSVFVLNLVNGRRERFATDNKEQLYTLRFSRPFIAASSVTGYCHVWNMDTSESASFPIPSLSYLHLVISGTKVVVRYTDHIVHWCFETRISRTLQIGGFVAALAVHPSEDQVTAVRFDRKDGEQHDALRWEVPMNIPILVQDYRLHVATYAFSSENEWCVLSSHYLPLPRSIIPQKMIDLNNPVDSFGICALGHSSVVMVQFDEETDVDKETDEDDEPAASTFCLYVEPDGRVAFHTCPPEITTNVELFSPEHGILYANALDSFWAILKCRTTQGPANSYVWYDYDIHETWDALGNTWKIGDARFMIFFDKEKMDVWVMEDDQEVEDWFDLRLG